MKTHYLHTLVAHQWRGMVIAWTALALPTPNTTCLPATLLSPTMLLVYAGASSCSYWPCLPLLRHCCPQLSQPNWSLILTEAQFVWGLLVAPGAGSQDGVGVGQPGVRRPEVPRPALTVLGPHRDHVVVAGVGPRFRGTRSARWDCHFKKKLY